MASTNRFSEEVKAWARMDNQEILAECLRVVRNCHLCEGRYFSRLRSELWYFCCKTNRADIFDQAVSKVQEEEGQEHENT